MVKYLIFGAGYLGTILSERLEDSELIVDKMRCKEDINEVISDVEPDIVINCIGKTGIPNVDWCEDNKVTTFFSNVLIPYWIADLCFKYDLHFINIGTGCVFQSTDFLDDDATPNFFGSFYSRTKLMTEDVLSEFPDNTNLRIRFPISGISNPKNFLYKVSKFNKVTDIENSVTFVTDIVNAIEFVSNNLIFGNVNLVHPITTSVKEIADKMGLDCEIVPQSEVSVGKRANTMLSPKKLLDAGFKFVDFDEELNKCIRTMNEEIKK